MCLGLIKRAVPFVLTLALGMLIASFFVSLSMPKIRFERRYEYRNECHFNSRAEKRERMRHEFQNGDPQNMDELVPPPPPVAPAIPFDEFAVKPPTAPTVSRNRR